MVKEFHDQFEQPVSDEPTLLEKKQYLDRIRLIQEELAEYIEACCHDNIVDQSDALADLLYVVFGTCVAQGLPIDELFKEVHESNMSKVGGYKDKGGKWIKPPTYRKADLLPILEKHFKEVSMRENLTVCEKCGEKFINDDKRFKGNHLEYWCTPCRNKCFDTMS